MGRQNYRGRPAQQPVRSSATSQRATSLDLRKEYPLPSDTMSALKKFVDEGKTCRNTGLLFDRYIGYLSEWRLDDKRSNPKKDHLAFLEQVPVEDELRRAAVARWRAQVGNLAEVFEATPAWRFLTGLGRKGPLEVGFTFHPLYGFPYIPGSSLKGLALAYARETTKDEELLERVFGSTQQQGQAVFHNALPVIAPSFEMDVMNPHYTDYYQDKRAPTNWQSPTPIFFLTLSKRSRFVFGVSGAMQAQASEWLKNGLRKLGAGAKTSAGYGYWRIDEQASK
jgi:CRISPR-associated protein Cmr6